VLYPRGEIRDRGGKKTSNSRHFTRILDELRLAYPQLKMYKKRAPSLK